MARQRLKHLDSLRASSKKNASPTQLIRASKNRVLWHRMVADVVNDCTAPPPQQEQIKGYKKTCFYHLVR